MQAFFPHEQLRRAALWAKAWGSDSREGMRGACLAVMRCRTRTQRCPGAGSWPWFTFHGWSDAEVREGLRSGWELPFIQRDAVVHAAVLFAHASELFSAGPDGVMTIANCEGREIMRTDQQLKEPSWRKVLDDFTKGYVECMIWSSNREGDEDSVQDGMDWDDLAIETKERVLKDCRAFQAEAARRGLDLTATTAARSDGSSEMAYAGHDFWLTREGHGCGFWDGDWPEELGKALTKLSKEFGETCGLTVDEDGLIYFF